MEIKGKNILITGAAKRIGAALALALAERGGRIVLHCNRSVEEAEALLENLPGVGHKILRWNFEECFCASELFAATGRRIDILINNASLYEPIPLNDESPELVRRHFAVNFFAPFELMKEFSRQADLRQGCIVNFLDQEVERGAERGQGSYIFSKKALREATLTAALEFAPRIRVNAIAPGPVLPPPWVKGAGMKKILAKVPMGRKVELDQIVDSCLFLLGNESVTGQILCVDGGMHLG